MRRPANSLGLSRWRTLESKEAEDAIIFWSSTPGSLRFGADKTTVRDGGRTRIALAR